MKAWYDSLQERERYILVGAAILLACLIFYVALWEPLDKRVDELSRAVSAGQGQLVWMRQAGQEAQLLKRGPEAGSSVNPRTSLITAVESSAKKSGLRSTVTRIEPQGSDKITVELRGAEFNRLVYWLSQLEKEYGAAIQQFNASKTEAPGRVDARLILTRKS